jgi:hypothetical protein
MFKRAQRNSHLGQRGSIDWSAFTSALTGVVPDIVALAAALVASVVTITVVIRAVRYVANLVGRTLR